jgi:hypothetical protein
MIDPGPRLGASESFDEQTGRPMAALTRLSRAWQAMERERRFAALAALALFISMFLPWYQQNGVAKTGIESRNLDAFAVFSFVEAAVLLVAIALIYMLFARAEGREFNLPGGDGTVVFAAGVWTGALLIFRLFDKPGISSHGLTGNVGVQWGIFFALAAAGLIAYSGSRMRAAAHGVHPPRRAGPPDAPVERQEPQEPEDRWAPEAEPPSREVLAPARAPASAPAGGRRRPRYPPSPEEQLSFEDPPSRPE